MDKYYHTKESVEEYIRLSEGYSGEKLIEQFIQYLAPKSKILEFGSGPGKDWKILTKKGFDVTGSDYSEEFLNHLENAFPTGKFIQLDTSKIVVQDNYDCIYSNKVMHHLTDEQLKNSLEKQNNLLNSGGVICHSFWKGEGDEEFKGMFVNYHTQKEIENIVNPYFEILVLEEYQEFEEGDSLILIGKRK